MAIKGEVHVKSMIWAPKISLNDGRYVIRPFECKIIGQAEGLARVKASIHTFFTTFDDEEWRIITLFVNHLDSKLKYTDLFAASCGSLGEFTDIKQSEEGYAMTRQMQHFNFPLRNLDGTFYAQVHPFDPSFFAVKVHPSGVLSFFKLLFWRSQYSSLMTPQSTGWKMMEQCVFIHLTDGNPTIQLPGCVNEGSIQYPPPSKRKLETLFTMDPNGMMIQVLLPRPLGGLYISLAAGHPMIHHLDCETSCRCP